MEEVKGGVEGKSGDAGVGEEVEKRKHEEEEEHKVVE